MTPTDLPLIPLRNTVLLPHLVVPLTLARPPSLAALRQSLSTEDKLILVTAQKISDQEDVTAKDLYHVGTKAIVRKVSPKNEKVQAVIQGLERVHLKEIGYRNEGLYSTILPFEFLDEVTPDTRALYQKILDTAKKIEKLTDRKDRGRLESILSPHADPLEQVYLLVSIMSLELAQEQAILEARSRLEVFQLVYTYLLTELKTHGLRREIERRTEKELSQEHRQFFLRQQLKQIRRELGDQDPHEAEMTVLRDKIGKSDIPDTIREEVMREMTRLEQLPHSSPDYQVTRSYLDFLLELPWKTRTTDNLDLTLAKSVLDGDHYNLEDVKERIVEQLALFKLNPKARSPILCFVGAPGVGKTSLGESIARALGRKFERISLAGLHDEAELRGHRRTYVGSMPGRILQAIRRAGVKNPLLMLDEIDKLGTDFRGDPSAVLMEILDPSQNQNFHDNYLNLPFDLSEVFFIATANSVDPIPTPLFDRMEIIPLYGYTEQEKRQIAIRYLLPRRLADAGLTEAQLRITEAAIVFTIQHYTREAGLRQLDRRLAKLVRKVARKIATEELTSAVLDEADVPKLLGPEIYLVERAKKQLPPGVATGLAWTEAGGDVLMVEVAQLSKGSEFTLTGHLGKVMSESAKTALSCIWAKHRELGIPADKFQHGLHVHVPAGATPKDGPSAGITIATAITSLFLHKPLDPGTAMTGEITLSGTVLPVGGVKEKILAAHRYGIQRVILPKENERELQKIPAEVKAELSFSFVETIEEVLVAALPDFSLKRQAARVVETGPEAQPLPI